MANKFKTREEWLAFVTNESRPLFKAAGFPIPKEVRFAIGFTSTGARGNRIGECWQAVASADKHAEIFIKPTESRAMATRATSKARCRTRCRRKTRCAKPSAPF